LWPDRLNTSKPSVAPPTAPSCPTTSNQSSNQSKIRKVTGGLTGLTSRWLTMKSSKKEDTVNVMGRHSYAGILSYCWADVWMLDMTQEGSCRMRKKLTPNPRFYALYSLTGPGAGSREAAADGARRR
jgi:hypothetical protein